MKIIKEFYFRVFGAIVAPIVFLVFALFFLVLAVVAPFGFLFYWGWVHEKCFEK